MAETLTNRQKSAPAAAVGVSVTPSGTAFVSSAWVQLIASAAADLALTSVICVTPGTTATFEVDIGVGGAGAEVVIATKKGVYNDTTNCQHGRMPFVLPLAAIPSGSRVAVRMRKSGTNTTAWVWAMEYIELPIVGTLKTSTRPTLVTAPAAALTTLNANLTAWAWGSWTQLIAAAAADSIITGLVVPAPFASADYEVEIGKGGVGSEIGISRVKGYATNLSDGPCFVPLWNPIDLIAAGNRVSARLRKAGTSATGLPFGLEYMEKPL